MNGRKRFTRQELLKMLRELADALGRRPERRDLENVKGTDRPSSQQITREFGSWSKGIKAAGLGDTRRPHKRKKKYICQHCGKEFQYFVSMDRKFCSSLCYASSNDSSGVAPWADHRNVAFRAWGEKCERCGYDSYLEYRKIQSSFMEYPSMLDVHHINKDRKNNTPENLAVLCSNCHALATRNITVYSRSASGKLQWVDLSVEEYKARELERREAQKIKSREYANKRRKDATVRPAGK